MLKSPENKNCYQYLRECTEIYDDFYMMQHFGVKYYRTEMFKHMNYLAGYIQKELGIKRGDVVTVFMPTTVQSIVAFYALNSIGVITNFVHPLMSTDFLKERIEEVDSKAVMILDLLAKDQATVKVLKSSDKWYGVTYKEDKPVVVAAIQKLKDDGNYPQKLWNK